MKNFNSTSFLKICCGISIVMLSCAGLFLTIKPSQAAPINNFPAGKTFVAGENGKYTLQYVANTAGSGEFFWHMIICNTETGNYKAYRWDKDKQAWSTLFNNSIAFPSLP